MAETDPESDEHWDEQFPSEVIFRNPFDDKIECLNMLDIISDRTDVLSILKRIGSFNWDMTYNWTVLSSCLEKAKYSRPGSLAKRFAWESSASISVEPEDPFETLWDMLVNAFDSNFINGDMKLFMQELCEHIRLQSPTAKDFFAYSPVPTSRTNSSVVLVRSLDLSDMTSVSDTEPTSPSIVTPSSSVLSFRGSLQRSGADIVVPDVVVCHRYKQLFVLNIECKRSSDNMNRAVVQCLKQMLSQMHRQNLHFGIVFSPLEWHVLVLHKTPSGLRIYQHQESLVTIGTDEHVLNVPSFIMGLDWIYKIMSYRFEENKDSGRKRKASDEENANI